MPGVWIGWVRGLAAGAAARIHGALARGTKKSRHASKEDFVIQFGAGPGREHVKMLSLDRLITSRWGRTATAFAAALAAVVAPTASLAASGPSGGAGFASSSGPS